MQNGEAVKSGGYGSHHVLKIQDSAVLDEGDKFLDAKAM